MTPAPGVPYLPPPPLPPPTETGLYRPFQNYDIWLKPVIVLNDIPKLKILDGKTTKRRDFNFNRKNTEHRTVERRASMECCRLPFPESKNKAVLKVLLPPENALHSRKTCSLVSGKKGEPLNRNYKTRLYACCDASFTMPCYYIVRLGSGGGDEEVVMVMVVVVVVVEVNVDGLGE
ncbi:hypothetical protein M0802_005691 [Mischocyttarus mexicanus]|nr:hypothetical protein M0802_005691 [Mischocyttarus mexicanus]